MKTLKALVWGRWPVLAAVIALSLHSGGALARTADLYDAPKVLSVSATPLDTAQTRDRIVAGGQALGWGVTREEPGLVELTFDKQGKHQVTVAARYDPSGYKIDYVRSHNLNYEELGGVRKIHPNYNRWVLNLIKRIGPV